MLSNVTVVIVHLPESLACPQRKLESTESVLLETRLRVENTLKEVELLFSETQVGAR